MRGDFLQQIIKSILLIRTLFLSATSEMHFGFESHLRVDFDQASIRGASKSLFLYRAASGVIFIQGVVFTGPPLKKSKSKIMLEYPNWASPGPLQKVKVFGLGLP